MNNQYTQKLNSKRGAALLIFILLFLSTSLIIVIGVSRGIYDDTILFRTLQSGKQSFYSAEAGIEDAIYRYRGGMNYSSTESFSVGGVPVSMTRTFVINSYEFNAEANYNNAIRRAQSSIIVGDGVSFEFGLQGGNGGITQSNNSKVYGDVFSNGSVIGAGNATVYGDVISAGATGLVRNTHATGSVWSNTIDASIVDKDAYYVTKIATVVTGSSFPGSPNQATATFPISDSLIEQWKAGIESTGTVIASTSPSCAGGTYTIQSSMELGNVKIECNLIIKKQGPSTVVTFTGPVWIEGNLYFNSGPSIVASTSLGILSTVIIVDKESNHATSSKISVNQATNFTSGDAKSYTLLLSMNNSSEMGGAVTAIDVGQSANGKVLLYASHGLVSIGNSITLKEVTAHQIDVNNGATIIYEAGLASLVFQSVIAGYAITSWMETE